MAEQLMVAAILSLCLYYAVAWWRVGRNPRAAAIVTRYGPPSGLSPAMMRYVWKEGFDDRTFWAAGLSLVSKGIATLDCKDGTRLRAVSSERETHVLSEEEQLLFDQLVQHGRKGKGLNMLDDETEYVAVRMASVLRRRAVGVWFRENREYVIPGALLSALPVWFAADPTGLQQWIAFAAALGAMAPGGFYLIFLLLRVRDVFRAVRGKEKIVLAKRALVLVGLMLPCIAALVLGAVVLDSAFGWRVLMVTTLMIGLDLSFLHLIKAPTPQGRMVLDEIAGFRQFLQAVDKLPMDRSDAPAKSAGTYEKYLPYAVALEVEQQWGDTFIALASTYHAPALAPRTHVFYLGMWNDRPVEMVFTPQRK